jgi:hypothetical protein
MVHPRTGERKAVLAKSLLFSAVIPLIPRLEKSVATCVSAVTNLHLLSGIWIEPLDIS